MTGNLPDLLLYRTHRPWTIDAVEMRLDASDMDGLPWDRAWTDLSSAEAGEPVNIDEQRSVGHTWLRTPETAPTVGIAKAIGTMIDSVREFAHAIHEGHITTSHGDRFTDVFHIGIGGSSLGAALLVNALQQPTGPRLRIWFLDNTDPDGIERHLVALGDRIRTTLVVMTTKSGTTREPNNASVLVRDALSNAAIHPPTHMCAITGEQSPLRTIAHAEGWLRVFPVWEWVGGRFSATSAVGLVPAALAGADINRLLAGARDMDDWTRITNWRENPAAMLAGSWYCAGEGQGRRAMVVLPYADRLALLSRYLQQLVMESVGKRNDRSGSVVEQGMVVYGNKGATDQHALVQQLMDGPDDFFILFVQVLGDGIGRRLPVEPGLTAGDYLQSFLLGTRQALTQRGRRNLLVTVPEVNAYVLGGLIALFERAITLYASLLDVNAYDQPSVEAGKRAAHHVNELSLRVRTHLATQGKATLQELTTLVGAPQETVFYVLQRLVVTRRVKCQGNALDGPYELVADD